MSHEYKCDKCGKMHMHKKFMFGSPMDYDCKEGQQTNPKCKCGHERTFHHELGGWACCDALNVVWSPGYLKRVPVEYCKCRKFEAVQ